MTRLISVIPELTNKGMVAMMFVLSPPPPPLAQVIRRRGLNFKSHQGKGVAFLISPQRQEVPPSHMYSDEPPQPSMQGLQICETGLLDLR